MRSDRVIIGTASFGQKYGVANRAPLTFKSAHNLVILCRELGFNFYDTAADYGYSEQILGRHSGIFVYSKLPTGTDLSSWDEVQEIAKTTRSRLHLSRLVGLSAHSAKFFLASGRNGVRNFMKLKELGIAEAWGVSVYDVAELKAVLQLASPDFIQAPVNFIDRRFISPEVSDLLEFKGVELHARSIYLQGALLMKARELPSQLGELGSVLELLSRISKRYSISIQELLFRFVAQERKVSKLVVGVNSKIQVRALACFSREEMPDLEIEAFHVNSKIQALIDPRNWVGI